MGGKKTMHLTALQKNISQTFPFSDVGILKEFPSYIWTAIQFNYMTF